MSEVDLAVALLVGLVALVVALVAYAALRPVAGVWRRSSDLGEADELILLEQLGPFVTGKRNVESGNQRYAGLQLFDSVRLSRRDFGLPALIAQGFPEVIAKQLNGTVLAKLRLKRRGDRLLEGWFSPQKVLFDEPSQAILSRHHQPWMVRSFERTALDVLPHTKAAPTRAANLPPPARATRTRKTKNTF